MRQARQAGLDEQPLFLPLTPLAYLRKVQRPGAYYTHFAFQYIKQLRQFVKGIFTQKFADSRQPGIFAGFGAWAERGSIDLHCAELVKHKRFAVFTRPFLPEYRRAFAAELDNYNRCRKNRKQNSHSQQGNEYIKSAFTDTVKAHTASLNH